MPSSPRHYWIDSRITATSLRRAMNPTASSTVARRRRRVSNRERRVNVLRRLQRENPSDKTNIENTANRRLKPLQSGRLIHSCAVRSAIKRLITIQRAQLVNIRRAPTPIPLEAPITAILMLFPVCWSNVRSHRRAPLSRASGALRLLCDVLHFVRVIAARRWWG